MFLIVIPHIYCYHNVSNEDDLHYTDVLLKMFNAFSSMKSGCLEYWHIYFVTF